MLARSSRMVFELPCCVLADRSRVLLSVVIGTTSITSLAPYIIDFGRAGSAALKLFQLIDRSSDIDPFCESGFKPKGTVGDVDLENITFAYPTRPGVTVLDDFYLHIPAGKVTALVVSILYKALEWMDIDIRKGNQWFWKEYHCWPD